MLFNPSPANSAAGEATPGSATVTEALNDQVRNDQVQNSDARSEDQILAWIKSAGLTADDLEKLSKTATAMKSRRIKLAVLEHPRTPRHVSVPLVSSLFTFDLMRVALLPVVPGDIKVAAERALIRRLDKIPMGEKLSLARRASGRIAGELLMDAEPRVVRAALENPRLPETSVIHAITRITISSTLVEAVCHHSHWSPRREIRMALLRCDKVPLARALEFARSLPRNMVHEMLQSSRLPEGTKSYLARDLGLRQGNPSRPAE